jgi:hypothetical protein
MQFTLRITKKRHKYKTSLCRFLRYLGHTTNIKEIMHPTHGNSNAARYFAKIFVCIPFAFITNWSGAFPFYDSLSRRNRLKNIWYCPTRDQRLGYLFHDSSLVWSSFLRIALAGSVSRTLYFWLFRGFPIFRVILLCHYHDCSTAFVLW